MTMRKLYRWMFLVLAIGSVLGLGCSDKTFTSSSTQVAPEANPTVYLPLEQGLRVTYIVTDQGDNLVDIEVLGSADVAGYQGHQMRMTNRTTGEITTFYRYEKDNAIFESYESNNPGYRILESPFVAGNSWSRFDTSSTESVDITGEEDDDNVDENHFGGGKGGITIFGDGFAKDKPGLNYDVMKIVGVEDVQGLDGYTYGNCLKVAWPTDPLHTSYFWYYPGVGLVKFEYGLNIVNDATGHVVGVMSNHQTVEY